MPRARPSESDRVRKHNTLTQKKRESNQESEIFVFGCIPSVLVGRRRFFLETRGTMEGLALWHRMAGIQMLDAGWVQQSVLLVLDSGSSGYSGVL